MRVFRHPARLAKWYSVSLVTARSHDKISGSIPLVGIDLIIPSRYFALFFWLHTHSFSLSSVDLGDLAPIHRIVGRPRKESWQIGVQI